MNARIRRMIPAAAAALFATQALAQVTPSDVRDLVGARAPGGESALASRGYVNVGGRAGGDRKWTYWWNATRGVCLSVATVQGRYDSIVATPAADCRGPGGYQPGDDRPGPGDRPGPPPVGPGFAQHIALVCYGEGERPTTAYRNGYEWDPRENRYVPRSRVEWTQQQYDTSLTIEIDGGRGRIRPARNMIPPISSGSDNGWRDLTDLVVGRDEIRGRFKLNGLNRPTVRIDRRSGRITLEGLTKFRGRCDTIDDRDRRRF